MLIITSLDEFRSKIAHKEEMREAEIAPCLISFCYMVAAENTFDDDWSRECRGIVFNAKTGKVVGRPLHKFFNVNERESTRAENLQGVAVRLMDKRDGSMIHTVQTGEYQYRLKSKKSFESDVAKQATEWVSEKDNGGYHAMNLHCVERGVTAIYEWTAPDARIVLPYRKSALTLLHLRNNETGEYWDRDAMRGFAEVFGVNCVDEHQEDARKFSFDIQDLLSKAKTIEDIEGWVIQFQDGEMVKLKTEWYLKRHRAMTFLRERDIAVLVLEEGLDDLKSMLVGDGVDITDILNVEQRVLHDLRQLVMSVEVAYEADKLLDRKTFAIKNQQHQHFGLLMAKFIGKEPNFKDYFSRNILKEQYGLRQLSLLESTAEVE